MESARARALGRTESVTIEGDPCAENPWPSCPVGLAVSYELGGALGLHACVRMVGSSEKSATAADT